MNTTGIPPASETLAFSRWASPEEVRAICEFFDCKEVSIYLLRSWWGVAFTIKGKARHFSMEEWQALLHPELEQHYEYVDVDGA